MTVKNLIYKRLVKSVVKKMLCRSDEDIEQEIYIRLWQKYTNAYTEQDKLGGWVRTVAENFCKDYLRSKSHRLLSMSVDEEAGRLEDQPVLETPEKQWLKKCRRKLVLQAVEELPSAMKKVVILIEFDGLSYEAAAKKLGISVGTVKSRLHNAKQKLHEKLAYLEL